MKEILYQVARMDLPFSFSIVLPSCCPFPAQFNTHKVSWLSLDFADKLDRAIHAARHVDRVSDLEVCACSAARGFDHGGSTG